MGETLAPVTDKERIASLDMLRGFAVLGILPMNIQSFSMIDAAYWNPTAYGNLHGANYLVWLLSNLLANLKFMNIFCMLFGAGIFLMTSRVEAAGIPPARLHYRRMAWLIVFGLLHSYLLWSGDILFDYGMCGLILYPLRNCRVKTLLVIGLLFVTISSAAMIAAGRSAAHWPPAQLKDAREDLWQPTPAQAAKELATYRGGWLGQTGARAEDSIASETIFFWGWAFWREGGLMLAGMALFRLGVFSARRSARFYWTLVFIAVCVGLPVTLYGTWRDIAGGWDFRTSFFFNTQFIHWASLLVSLGWVGLVMLASKSPAFSSPARRLSAVGRMAFTNYILQTLICTTIFYGHGLGLFGKVERTGQLAIVVAIWALQFVISPIWLRRFQFGPLEWLWRSLTYWRIEPWRRPARAAAQLA
jgi:uncharacterized protein